MKRKSVERTGKGWLIVTTLGLTALALTTPPPALAQISVAVDTGDYAGQWSEGGPFRTGDAVIDLAPGSNLIRIGSHDSFAIDVAASGVVTVTNGISALGGLNTLAFLTTTIAIDPASYSGDWWLNQVSAPTTGPGSLDVVPGLRYGVRVAGAGGTFIIDVAGDGTVTVDNGISATGGLGTLLFVTTPVSIDPAGYDGQWDLLGASSFATGSATFDLVPGVFYRARPGSVGNITFDLAADGTVASRKPAAATGGAGMLTFNTISIAVDPQAYSGAWGLSRVRDEITGSLTFPIVPDNRYFGSIAALDSYFVDVDAAGNVSVTDPASATGGAPIGGVSPLTLNNTTIFIEPDNPSRPWFIHLVTPSLAGTQSVVVVPGTSYVLSAAAAGVFTVAEPCAVDPSSLTLGSDTFALGCGVPDTDGDGVPDDTDNCLLVPNPDQLDQDLDGLGNACDDDLDGDGFDNDSDNCPDIHNDQADLDGDGVGDACDEDADGDSVPDDADNCLGLSNPDQADADLDGLGDPCDADDDNDGVADDGDNCPFDANPDQEDFDGDGEGDACDGDSDGDGVANASDLCPLSSADRPVDANGCTGSQFIALACDAADFAQHGQYVSCVAHAANEAVDRGTLTPQEKSRFVKEAAKAK